MFNNKLYIAKLYKKKKDKNCHKIYSFTLITVLVNNS